MKIKNIMLVLVTALLVLLRLDSVEASTCITCKGDWESYYSTILSNPYYWKSIAHFQYYDGDVGCKTGSYGLGANGDKLYMIQFDLPNSIDIGYIYISEDEQIEIYDNDGNVVTKYVSDYESSGYGGTSNGKTFGSWIHTFVDKPYELNYCDGFDFVIDCTDLSWTEQKDKLDELARYLCGETPELPTGVTISQQKPIKDLEPPLNVKVDGISNNIFNNKQKSLKIRWEQSNVDLTGYETHFYFKENGRTRKTIFNEWQDVTTPWLFDQKFTTAKYCNNNLKYYEYKWWTEQSKLGDYANALLYGDESGGLMCEHSAVDFMIRNEKIDDNGVQHYSNWVYVNCFNDGTYQIYEMSDDYTLDEDSDETGNIKTDSDIYDDEIIYDEKDFDSSGVGDASNFVDSMKDLISSLREFPNLFAKIFSFFPAWILALIGMLFVAVLLARLFL